MEEREFKPACRGHEDRLESALEGYADAEFAAHLEKCAGCRAALDRARQAGELLLETQERTPDPGNWFATRVMARIREEERRRVTSLLWGPIESLASRLAMGVGMVLILLCAYVYESSPRQVPAANGQAEVASEFPQQPSHPADKDEVLASLSGVNYEY
ncbi:MAG: hypothetical protein ACLP1Y_02305 [Candidatus Acidiferrales bacterium]